MTERYDPITFQNVSLHTDVLHMQIFKQQFWNNCDLFRL